ncbi:hypothetical protein DVA85_25120, partial [Acinetobacter sp. RIT592]
TKLFIIILSVAFIKKANPLSFLYFMLSPFLLYYNFILYIKKYIVKVKLMINKKTKEYLF